MANIIASPYTYATIVAIGAFIAAFASQQMIKQTKETNAMLEENKQSITDTLSKTVEAKEEIIGMLTGGDSYPTILYNKDGFLLASHGKYGIPNLKLQIVHISDYQHTSMESISNYLNNNKTNDNISVVYTNIFTKTFAGTVHTIKLSELNIEIDKNISHGFDFNFSNDFKRWVQRVRLIPVNGKWEVLDGLEEEVTYKKDIHSVPAPKTIHFRASQNFPYLENIQGKKYGANKLYYHLTVDRESKLNYHNLFNRSFEMTRDRIMDAFDINYFDRK